MVLSLDEIKRKASEQRKRRIIQLAVLHQNRLRFHAETVPSTPALASWTYRERKASPEMWQGREGVGQALMDFMAMVEKLIPHDKYEVFRTLFRFPVKTNEVLSVCFDKLSRIFDGRDPAYAYQFASTEQRDDWEWYRQEKLHEPEVWQTKGWDFFKTQINSVLVVDLPEEQDKGDRLPQPYFYWLPISEVLDFEANEQTGVMEYLIFRQDDDRIAVIDDEYYRLFKAKNGTIGELEREARHDLGYCPARFFWNEPISLDQPYIKASPVTKELDNLDWFLFYSISKRNLDMYGSYPIYWGYEQSCDFHNDETGDYCDGGFLKNREGKWLYDNNGLLVPCPLCSKKHIAGAGSFVEVPVPIEGQPDLRNPVGMLAVDRNSLDYTGEQELRLRTDIITAIVGQNEEVTQREALNEQQIKANFESQSTVLKRVKKGFEGAQQFVDETCCRLRYGKAFLSASINYGTEFYLFTSDELRKRYKDAKDAGMSEADLDALLQQIIETEYRHNPQQMQRMIIMADLEPYRHLTRDEVQALYEKGIVTKEDFIIKLNFADYVRRFERENMNIIEFGDTLDYQKKIDIIKERFKEYAAENEVEEEKPEVKEETEEVTDEETDEETDDTEDEEDDNPKK